MVNFSKMDYRMRNYTNHRIKNIIFDFDETLLLTKPHISEFIQNYLNQKGITFSRTQEIKAGQWSHKFWEDSINFGRDSDEDTESSLSLWLRYIDKYYDLLGLDKKTNRELFTDLAIEIDNRKFEKYLKNDTISTLVWLKAKGYRLGILSNRATTISSIMKTVELDEFFDYSVTAGELGVAKPNPKIFTEFFIKFNGNPEESIYVGDNYWLDIVCADKAGLQPVLFDYFQWYQDTPYPAINSLSQLVDFLDKGHLQHMKLI